MSATPNKLHQFSNYNFTIVLSAYKDIDDLDLSKTTPDINSDNAIVIAATGGTYNFKNSILNKLIVDGTVNRQSRGDYFIDSLEIDSFPVIKPVNESIIPSNISIDLEMDVKETYGFSFLNVAKQALLQLNPLPENIANVYQDPTVFGGYKGIFDQYLLTIFFNKNASEPTINIAEGERDIYKPIHGKVSFIGGSMKINETGTQYRFKLQFFNGKKLLEDDPAALQETLTVTGITVEDFVKSFVDQRNTMGKDNKSNIEYEVIPDNDLAIEFFKSRVIDLDPNSQNLAYAETASLYNINLGLKSIRDFENTRYRSSAAGAYQIVQNTRLDIEKNLTPPIKSTDIYNVATQDRLAEWLWDNKGPNQWEALKKYQANDYAIFKKNNGQRVGFTELIDVPGKTNKITPKDLIKEGESGSAGYDAVLNSDPGRPGIERPGQEVLADWWKLIKKETPKNLSAMTIAELNEFQTYIKTKGDPINPVTTPEKLAENRRTLKAKFDELRNSPAEKITFNVKNNLDIVLYDLLLNSDFFLSKFLDEDNADVVGTPPTTYFLNSFIDINRAPAQVKVTYYIKIANIPTPMYRSKQQSAVDARKTSHEAQTIKEYNYLFTGKNIDILRLELDFNNIAGYYFAIDPDRENAADNTASSTASSSGPEGDKNEVSTSNPNESTVSETVATPISTYLSDNPFSNKAAGFYRNIILPFTEYSSALSLLDMEIIGDMDLLPEVTRENFTKFTGSLIKLNIGNTNDVKTFDSTQLNYDGIMFSGYYQLSRIRSTFSSNGQFKMSLKASIIADQFLE